MSKLKPLKVKEVIRKLKMLGFVGPIAGGKHLRMVHPGDREGNFTLHAQRERRKHRINS